MATSHRLRHQNRLAIIPDQAPYDVFASAPLVPTVLPFLDGKTRGVSEQEERAA